MAAAAAAAARLRLLGLVVLLAVAACAPAVAGPTAPRATAAPAAASAARPAASPTAAPAAPAAPALQTIFHNSSDPRILQYSPSSLVHMLHRLPHYDFDLHKVDASESSLDALVSGDYRQSIGLLMTLPILVALLVCLSLQVALFCGCCGGRCSAQRLDPKAFMYLRMSTMAVALLLIAVAGWSLQRSNIMYSRTTDFEHHSNELEDSYELAVSLATNFYDEANITHIVAKQLQFALELDHNAPNNVKTSAKGITAQAWVMAYQMDSILYDAPDFDMDHLNSRIQSTSHYHWVCALLLCIGVILLSVGTACNAFVDSMLLHLASFSVSLLLMIFASVAVGLHLGTGVTGADVCMNPTETLLKHNTEADMVAVYLNCPHATDNPMPGNLVLVDVALNFSMGYIEDVLSYTHNISAYEADSKKIANNLDSMATQFPQFKESVECLTPHNQYIQLVGLVCDDFLHAVVYLLALETVMAVLLMILTTLAIASWRYHRAASPIKAAPSKAHVDEHTPLLADGGRGDRAKKLRGASAASALSHPGSLGDSGARSVNREPDDTMLHPGAMDFTDLAIHVDSRLLCKICLSRKVNMALTPCGHVLCSTCGLTLRKCPFCRKEITGRNSVFLN